MTSRIGTSLSTSRTLSPTLLTRCCCWVAEFGTCRGLRPPLDPTISDPEAARSPQRRFVMDPSSRLWVSNLPHVWTTKQSVFTALVIDVFYRASWGGAPTDYPRTDRVLDELDQPSTSGSTARSAAGKRYSALRSTDRLARAGSVPSIGSVGRHPFGNAMAESITGLCRAEVIYRRERWDCLE